MALQFGRDSLINDQATAGSSTAHHLMIRKNRVYKKNCLGCHSVILDLLLENTNKERSLVLIGHSLIHSTLEISPGPLVFHRNTILDIPIIDDL